MRWSIGSSWSSSPTTLPTGGWENLGQLADIGRGDGGDDDGMEIRICLDQSDPPVGRLLPPDGGDDEADDEAAIRFCGWLGLLRALSDTIESAEAAGPGCGDGAADVDGQRRQ